MTSQRSIPSRRIMSGRMFSSLHLSHSSLTRARSRSGRMLRLSAGPVAWEPRNTAAPRTQARARLTAFVRRGRGCGLSWRYPPPWGAGAMKASEYIRRRFPGNRKLRPGRCVRPAWNGRLQVIGSAGSCAGDLILREVRRARREGLERTARPPRPGPNPRAGPLRGGRVRPACRG